MTIRTTRTSQQARVTVASSCSRWVFRPRLFPYHPTRSCGPTCRLIMSMQRRAGVLSGTWLKMRTCRKMNKNSTKSRNAQRGFSLIELMIVVAIIAVISAFAYPSYDRYVIKTKRSVAQNALLQVADRQQQFFMDNKRFATDITNLGYQANPYVVDDNGTSTVAADGDAV